MHNSQENYFGRYRLLHQIGQGSFAHVYLAEHPPLKTQFALKIMRMPPSEEANVELLKEVHTDILREAEIGRSLTHPHIVPVYDCGVEAGVPYIAMAYASNGSLRMLHPRRSYVASALVVHYVRQIASALAYAHSHNVIHRDVKPGNMLLGPNKELWLSDFGIALVLSDSQSLALQEVVGTLYYMAPEQARGKPCFASDQYALAAVAYTWLSGRPPFMGSYTEVITQLVLNPVPSLCAANPAVSPALEAVILKALAKDPQERFASVLLFADALEAAYNEPLTEPLANEQLLTASAAGLSVAASHPPLGAVSAGEENQQVGKVAQPPQPVGGVNPQLASVRLLPLATPVPALTPPIRPASRPLSRRILLGGLLGFVVVAGTGVAVFETHALDLSRGQEIRPTKAIVPHEQPPTHVATSQVPLPPAGKTIFSYFKHVDQVKTLAWSPDGKRIVSAGADNDETVHIWDATTGEHELVYLRHQQAVSLPHKNPVKAAQWSSDGTYIASADDIGKAHVWYASNGQDIPSSPYNGHTQAIRCLAWAPSTKGLVIATGSEDLSVQVWNALSGQRTLLYRGHASIVFAVAWSPDGKYIASGSGDRDPASTTGDTSVQLWDASTGQPLQSSPYIGHNRTVRSIAWSPVAGSNQIATASEDGTVQVWDAFTGALSIAYKMPYGGVEAISWSPDGRFIVAAGGKPLAQVWEVATGKTLLSYQHHTIGLWAVAWSPDGNLIASGGMDHIVRVWIAPRSS